MEDEKKVFGDSGEELSGAEQEIDGKAAESAMEAAESEETEKAVETPKQDEPVADEPLSDEASEAGEAEQVSDEDDAAGETDAAVQGEADGEEAKDRDVPVIKRKKRGVNKTVIILVIVIVVMALAATAYILYKEGVLNKWFAGNGKQTLGDYSTIEVLKSDVEVSDEMVEEYISSLLDSQSETVEETKGVVADGDVLDIDYVGTLVQTGEQFDGGTAEHQSLTIGSGQMIDGFESGLIGKEIGTTVPVNVVFPENYQAKELAGQPAVFNITINSRTVTKTPELTDDFAKDFSEKYLDKELKTVGEFKEYARDYLYKNLLHNAMFQELQSKQTVESYNINKEDMLKQYFLDSIDYYAAMYGTNADQYAQMYGADDAEAYALDEAHYYLDSIMLVDKIIKDKNIKWTQEELDRSLELFIARQYGNQYTLEEFKENSGVVWLYLYENLEFKYNLAMEALEPNVKFVDEKTAPEASESETETKAAK